MPWDAPTGVTHGMGWYARVEVDGARMAEGVGNNGHTALDALVAKLEEKMS